ncbi:hypothetical protein QQ056_05395 [Oscillatoria laete-virens NRMC-F 0139]|nr:hypothetical protein [Oscillatoria laete-virens]MDL5052988.1 hypothetical protein [Oscillatoria laete-virens NRMC-F 0139]
MPGHEHRVILPRRNWREQFARETDWAGAICGYSFGAFLILKDWASLPVSKKPVTLYAPFLDFKAESGLGSKIKLTQLKFLRRWLSRSPLEGMNDFYLQAGLSLPPAQELPYDLNDLLWGVDEMIHQRVTIPNIPQTPRFLCGNYDNLIDKQKTKDYIDTLEFVCGGHCILDFLIAATSID